MTLEPATIPPLWIVQHMLDTIWVIGYECKYRGVICDFTQRTRTAMIFTAANPFTKNEPKDTKRTHRFYNGTMIWDGHITDTFDYHNQSATSDVNTTSIP
jgi:hypothetical protein